MSTIERAFDTDYQQKSSQGAKSRNRVDGWGPNFLVLQMGWQSASMIFGTWRQIKNHCSIICKYNPSLILPVSGPQYVSAVPMQSLEDWLVYSHWGPQVPRCHSWYHWHPRHHGSPNRDNEGVPPWYKPALRHFQMMCMTGDRCKCRMP